MQFCHFSLILAAVETQAFAPYVNILDGKKEKFRHVRLVFVGKEGVGKTTICRRLQGKKVQILMRNPTNGLHMTNLLIDWSTKEWQKIRIISSKGGLSKKLTTLVTHTQQSKREDQLRKDSRSGEEIQHEKSEDKSMYVGEPNEVFVSLWDMGGYMSFQATHNFFISSHGVYLLTFRLDDYLVKAEESERLKKWIRAIGTFSSIDDASLKLKKHYPPIIFVGTFLDQLKDKYKDPEKEITAIQRSISRFPEISRHPHIGFCTVDNTLEDDPNLENLRGKITELAVHQDQWDRELPTRWLKLKQDLLEIKEERPILHYHEVVNMTQSSAFPIGTDEELKMALEYLHCIRSVIYFRDLDFVINDPQWLARAFSLLITDDQYVLPTHNLHILRELDIYKRKGEITPSLIEALLSMPENGEFYPHRQLLMKLMGHFGLVANILLGTSNQGRAEFSEKYTVPSKLSCLTLMPDLEPSISKAVSVSKTLCLVFREVFVPEELFDRIYAEVMTTFAPLRMSVLKKKSLIQYLFRPKGETTISLTTQGESDPTCLFRGFGCFRVNDLCNMVVSMHWIRSAIAVTLFSFTEKSIHHSIGSDVKHKLVRIVERTLAMSKHQHFDFSFLLHCHFNLAPGDTPVDLYGINLSEEGVLCKGSHCHGKHRLTKKDTELWDLSQVNQTSAQSTVEERKLHALPNRRASPKELGRLSRHISLDQCEILFVFLGLHSSVISTIRSESSSLAGVSQITKMFLRWRNAYPNSTLQDLEDSLNETEMTTPNWEEILDVEREAVETGITAKHGVLSRVPTKDDISTFVRNIGNSYFNLFLELGLDASEIEQCDISYSKTVKSTIQECLKQWIRVYEEEATNGRLLTAMKVYGMDWQSVVDTLQ